MDTDPRQTVIDVTPDGQFRAAPRQGWGLAVTGAAALAAIALVVVLSLAVAVWLAVTILPVVVAIALISLLAARWRLWKRQRGVGRWN